MFYDNVVCNVNLTCFARSNFYAETLFMFYDIQVRINVYFTHTECYAGGSTIFFESLGAFASSAPLTLCPRCRHGNRNMIFYITSRNFAIITKAQATPRTKLT